PVGAAGSAGFARSVLREGRKAICRLLDQESFDLVNVHQPLAAAAVLEQVRSNRLPVLYTYLSPWADEYRIRHAGRAQSLAAAAALAERAWVQLNGQARERMEHRAVLQSDRMLVLSDFSRSQLREIHGVPMEKVTVVPGGVDTEKF